MADTTYISPESIATVPIFLQPYKFNKQQSFVFKHPTLLMIDNGTQPNFVIARGIIQAGGNKSTIIKNLQFVMHNNPLSCKKLLDSQAVLQCNPQHSGSTYACIRG